MESRDATAPLDDIFNETLEYCGRMYQKYALANGTYFVPIDEEEVDCMESLHAVFRKVFDNRLVFPPVSSPHNILDCGCGTGNWAVEVADEYPNAEVLAIDMSPQMIPADAPDNVEFQIDDLNARFTFRDNCFDLVHSQLIAGGLNAARWPSYVRDIYRVIKPGGWCQMVELYLNAQSDNGTLRNDHALSKWSRCYLQPSRPPKDPRAALQLATWMSNAGFVDVESKLVTLPMCAWSNDPRDREIGQLNNFNIQQMLYSLALYPFTKQQGMDVEEVKQLVEEAYREASNPSFKAYFALYIFIGRKSELPAETRSR